MKDINAPLQTVWYQALQATGDEYFVDEEPNDTPNALYGVIGAITVTDDSDMTCTKVQATIQISLHSRRSPLNNRITLNQMADRLFSAVIGNTNNVIDMSAYNIQMTNLRLIQDTQQDNGRLGNYDYKTRVLIFRQGLFIK